MWLFGKFCKIIWQLLKESLELAIILVGIFGIGWGILILIMPDLFATTVDMETLIIKYGGLAFLILFGAGFLLVSVKFWVFDRLHKKTYISIHGMKSEQPVSRYCSSHEKSDVTLREYTEKDSDTHYKAVTDSLKELQMWFTWCNPYYCHCQSQDFVSNQQKRQQEGQYDFAIVDRRTDELLGSCGINIGKDLKNYPTVSYWIRSGKHGKGIMKKAIKQLMVKAHELGLNIVAIDIAYCNESSKGVIKCLKVDSTANGINILGGDQKIHKGARYLVKI